MGSVLLFDAVRMKEIEDGTVTSGLVDSNGHLILKRRDNGQIDAGKVQPDNLADASTAVKGIVELATSAETLTGTDTVRAVTPKGLRDMKATDAEAVTATDDQKYVSPKGAKAIVNDRTELYTGIVNPYWSSGKPKVTLDANQNVSGDVDAFLPPNSEGIQPGSSVTLSRIGSAWYIEAPYAVNPAFMKQIPMQPLNGWILYADYAANDINTTYGERVRPDATQIGSAAAGPVYVTRSITGVVNVMGLLMRGGGVSVGSPILQLPPGCRPERRQMFCLYGAGNGNQGFYKVAVLPSGWIVAVSFQQAAPYNFMGLDSICFRAAGTQTFVPITSFLSPNWQGNVDGAGYTVTNTGTGETLAQVPDTTGAGSHTPGYTIDSEGLVLWEGDVTPGSAAQGATSTIASGMTAAFGATGQLLTMHQQLYSGNPQNFVRVGGASAGLGNAINLGGSTVAVGTRLNLAQLKHINNDAFSTATIERVWKYPQGENGWVAYDPPATSFAAPRMTKLPSGLVLPSGFWRAGTLGAAMTWTPKGWRPRFQSMFAVVAAEILGRIDVVDGRGEGARNNPGAVFANTVSQTWTSMDGIAFPAYM